MRTLPRRVAVTTVAVLAAAAMLVPATAGAVPTARERADIWPNTTPVADIWPNALSPQWIAKT